MEKMEELQESDACDGDSKSAEASGKRSFVLGVVDTTGMKSANSNRKRRWDQAPNEVDPGSPVARKVFVGDGTEEESHSPMLQDSEAMVTEDVPEVEENADVKDNSDVDPKASKVVQGTVEKSFISDSLKRIQFSYDEGDSNSSDTSIDNTEQENQLKVDANSDLKTEVKLTPEGANVEDKSQLAEEQPNHEDLNSAKAHIQDAKDEQKGSIEAGIDPTVFETILGSNKKPVIFESEDTNSSDKLVEKSEFEIASTEVIVIDPTEPLSEELSQDASVEKSREKRLPLEENETVIEDTEVNVIQEDLKENIEDKALNNQIEIMETVEESEVKNSEKEASEVYYEAEDKTEQLEVVEAQLPIEEVYEMPKETMEASQDDTDKVITVNETSTEETIITCIESQIKNDSPIEETKEAEVESVAEDVKNEDCLKIVEEPTQEEPTLEEPTEEEPSLEEPTQEEPAQVVNEPTLEEPTQVIDEVIIKDNIQDQIEMSEDVTETSIENTHDEVTSLVEDVQEETEEVVTTAMEVVENTDDDILIENETKKEDPAPVVEHVSEEKNVQTDVEPVEEFEHQINKNILFSEKEQMKLLASQESKHESTKNNLLTEKDEETGIVFEDASEDKEFEDFDLIDEKEIIEEEIAGEKESVTVVNISSDEEAESLDNKKLYSTSQIVRKIKYDTSEVKASQIQVPKCNKNVKENKPTLDPMEIEIVDPRAQLGKDKADDFMEVCDNKADIPEENQESIPVLKIVTSHNSGPYVDKVFKVRDKSPKLSPVTLKIDTRDKSPLTIECKSPQGPKDKPSPHKQLEFTLKIAKDANTNIPKATMSPKSGMSLSPNSIWKIENEMASTSKKLSKKLKAEEIKSELMSDSSNQNDDVKTPQAENNLQDVIKKMLEIKEEIKMEPTEVPIKVPKKRGRPRKIVPSEPVESHTFSAPEEPDDIESNRPMRSCRGRTKPIVVRTRKPRGGGVGRGGGRGRGMTKPLPADRESLSEYEKAELAKIEARKEKIRLDQIAKYKAIKEKKLAKKLKDEERRKRIAREKAEKAEAAAPQVFEEETRMSAPESGSRGHTPAPNRINFGGDHGDESQSSIISTPTNPGNKKGRMEIPIDYELKEVTVDQLAEYQWQGSELFMIQEQVSLYLGVKSFKRKYPDLKRRPVEAEERTHLEDSGLVPKSMCDLGLTAVSSAEVLDVMFQDFPDKYEEFRKYVREKQARETSSKQRALAMAKKDGSKIEPREQALEAVATWNANLNRERKEERRCALDLQTFTIHYPKNDRETMSRPVKKVGLYPLAIIPGQYCDYYKKCTPTELMYYPLNTVLYGPLKPNEKQSDNSDSGSDSDDSSSSDDSSDTSSESDSSEDDEDTKCKLCNGTKKNNKNSQSESLIQCAGCKKHVHPTCLDLTPEMLPHIEKYNWVCQHCKKCVACKESTNLDKLMTCDLCNRGYHVYCVGLRKIPEGRWHCTICSYCTSCGTRDPGGTDWQHEFKKSEKGAKIYQRTLCTPCFKLWRKGKYCQICSKCYGWKPEEDTGLKQCNTCDRWIHKECFNIRFGAQAKQNTGFQCDLCQERVQSSLSSHGISRPLIKV